MKNVAAIHTYILLPPYDRLHRIASANTLQAGHLPLGAILALQPTCPVRDDVALCQTVSDLRQAFPFAPVIVYLGREHPEASLHLARRCGAVGVRAVVCEGEPIEPTLRRVVTAPVDLGRNIAEWLTSQCADLTLEGSALVTRMVAVGFGQTMLKEVLDPHIDTKARLRKRCRALGIPSPREWVRLGRVLNATLAIQRRPEIAVEVIAAEAGYPDRSLLSRHISVCFGLTPTRVRHIIGWEGLVYRWWGRYWP